MSAPDISTPKQSGIEAAAAGLWKTIREDRHLNIMDIEAALRPHVVLRSDHSKVVQELALALKYATEIIQEHTYGYDQTIAQNLALLALHQPSGPAQKP